MESGVLIFAGVVAFGAVVVICLLLKMIVSGDYSLLLNKHKQEASPNVFGSAGELRLETQVPEHLMPETRAVVKQRKAAVSSGPGPQVSGRRGSASKLPLINWMPLRPAIVTHFVQDLLKAGTTAEQRKRAAEDLKKVRERNQPDPLEP